MAIIQISKIQQRSGNIVDLPQLDEAEFGWATDVKKLYIGKTTPNENIEVLTSYSNISFSQIDGSYGNLNVDGSNIADGQIMTYTGSDWTNRGGNIGGLINLGDVANVKIGGGALSYVLETDGTGNLTWAPKTTIIAFVENATQTNPCVITTTQDNDFVNGSEVTFTNVPGMTDLNGNSYYAKIGVTGNTFSLYSDISLTTPVDASGFGAFPFTDVANTYSGTNQIKIGDTSLVNVNDPIRFVGTLFGGLEANTTYYITAIPVPGAPGTITVSLTEGGANVVLNDADGPSANLYVTGGRIVSLVSSLGGTTGVAAGTNTMVQFNNTNVLDASSALTFDFATNLLTVGGNTNVSNLNATSLVTGSRFISSVGTGTEPLTVTSTTRVANLNVTSSNNADFAGNVTVATQGNITSLGTLTTLNVNARVNATGYTSNVATGTAPFTVTSTTRVANLNVANANMADFAGNVTVASQSNITSLGTLTQLDVNARVNATGFTSNVATGTAPLTVTSTTRVANLNVNYANVSDFSVVTNQSTGIFYLTFANGSTTANRALGTNGNLAFNAATGNLSTSSLYASGNISGGNISTAGTGNIATLIVPTLANVTSATGSSSTTTGALVVAGGVGVAGNINSGGNISGGNISITGTGNIATLIVPTLANVTSTTAASSTATGALQVAGGAGVGGNLYVGSNIVGSADLYASNSIFSGKFIESPYSIVAPQKIINPGTGALTGVANSISTGTNPYNIAVDPTGRFVYATNYSSATVSQYSINQSTGALTSITTAIASGNAPYGIAVDPTGRFVYVTNSASNTISQYSINQSTGALTSITTAIASGTNPTSIAVDPTGKFVYVTNGSSNSVSQYSINQSTGALTSITTAIASGVNPYNIAVDPTGRFVYVVNYNASTVSQYSINQSTGALTSITTDIATGSSPWGVVVDSTGRFVYVTNYISSTVSQYSINQSTGALTSITTAIASGTNATGISVDPIGRFVYVANFTASTISQYSINQSTGALTSITSVATGTNPYGMSVDPTGRFIYAVNFNGNAVSQHYINNLSAGAMTITGNLNVSGTIVGNITSLTTGVNTTAGSVTGNWTLTAGSRWNATYADLAEYYNADQNYEPGTVLEFGGINEVTIASNNTTSVAGVVSTDPAFAMNAKCHGEHPVAIALQGRVPTKVTGTIRKGDMMISAGNGYATACSSPIIGTVIGKSLENFNGEGIIEIAIGRL